MLLAFNSSMAMLISVLATFFTGICLIIQQEYFGIPTSFGIILIMLSVCGMIMLLSAVPKLYKETLTRCSDDIDGFVKEQNNIAKRSFGKKRLNTKMNLIFGLIAHQRFDEAESWLMRVAPLIDRTTIPSHKLNYLLYMLAVYKYRHNYESYSYTMEKLLYEIQNNPKLFPLERVEYEFLAELDQLETAFFTRTPEMLSDRDREIAEKLNFLVRTYLSQEHIYESWTDYRHIHYNYILGITYAVLGDNRSAEFYLGNTASQPFTYPDIMKARAYMQTKDIHLFF